MSTLNPIRMALRGKGAAGAVRRAGAIVRAYGFSRRRMTARLACLAGVAERYGCGVTVPVVASVLERGGEELARVLGDRLEIAVHGLYHVDHSELPRQAQLEQFARARECFERRGLPATGFRAPYLRCSADTLEAVRQAGFLYDSSLGIGWQLPAGVETPEYRDAISFYGAIPAARYPSLPRIEAGLVRIPYCLPDDEALSCRLRGAAGATLAALWPRALSASHRRGELFSLGLHPERIDRWRGALESTLGTAARLSPPVWLATLEDVARWWNDRSAVVAEVSPTADGGFHARGTGPEGLAFLVRDVEVASAVSSWSGRYRRVHALDFSGRSSRWPVLGIGPGSAAALGSFLSQQGFIWEEARPQRDYGIVLERRSFGAEDERALLSELSASDAPLIRLGRWPAGAKSAFCLSGDVDALTLWDYGYRFFRR